MSKRKTLGAENGEHSQSRESEASATKKKPKTRAVQHFRMEWLSIPEYKYWLAPVPNNTNKAKCIKCRKEFKSEITVIKHLISQSHRQNMNVKKSSNVNIMGMFLEEGKREKLTKNFEVKSAEIKLCGMFVEHNFSFNSMDHVERALKNCIHDSEILNGISLKRTKATAITKNVMALYEKDEISSSLTNVKFSCLIDESTDITTKKTCVVVVRYFDRTMGKITSKLFDLLEVFKDGETHATAEHLYNLVINAFEERKINLDNLIGFGADGCNTLFGANNSVVSRLQKNFPGIVTVKCICHSLHLCASSACEQLPNDCEKLARNIYNFFKDSSNRQADFEQFQAYAEVEIHKILRPSQTRWLSVAMVSQRILEQWNAVQTLSGILLSSQHVRNHGTCVNFNPPVEMIRMCNTRMYDHKNSTCVAGNGAEASDEPGCLFETE